MVNKIYDWVTERIIAQLEKGTIPWRCPWITGGRPMNLISKRPYRGINVWMLLDNGFTSPYYLSFKQVKAKGGRVVKGSKSTMIVFWKFGERQKNGIVVRDNDGKASKWWILRYYNVFNVEQTTGIDYPKLEIVDHDPIEACDKIMAEYETCPPITHEGGRAYYRQSDDTITMPPMGHFTKTPEYYSTLFHEAAHSTGHKSRLGRELNGGGFGSQSYSFEELVAEMTAAMLCGTAGIEMATLENSAAYIANWLSKFKNDTTMVVKAAGKAQKAVDFITNYKYEGDKNESQDESDSDVASKSDIELAHVFGSASAKSDKPVAVTTTV